MTDTVNVPREWLRDVFLVLSDWKTPLGEKLFFDTGAMLTAAPKAEPVSETVRLSLETANYLERIAEEADDNQWQDWAATMRQAAGQMRRLCSAQPEAPKVEQGPVWVGVDLATGDDKVIVWAPPATASGELLEALEVKLNEYAFRVSDYVVEEALELIAKHKGPQS